LSTIPQKPKRTVSSAALKQRREKLLRDRKDRPSQSYWAAEQQATETGVESVVRRELLKQHGSFTLAYSTSVQPLLEHYGDQHGLIAYRSRWGVTCALGDPLCEDSHRDSLIRQFVQKYRRPMFCQVSEKTAKVLANQGYYINPMGIDTTLVLDDYTLGGKKKEWLRYAGNWTKRRGYEIRECSFEEISADCVEQISEAWRETRTVKQKEVRFLNRPIVLEDEPDVRKFFLIDPAGQPIAFVFLDPLYRDGTVIGYATSFKRRHPDAPQYGEQAIMKHIIEKLKSESVDLLKLGLSPLASIETTELPTSLLTAWLFRNTYESKWINRHFYHLKGHTDYKRRFQGCEEPYFLAMPCRFSPRRLAALLALSGIV
jgi:phosphatidylglycerol lysyltransferase